MIDSKIKEYPVDTAQIVSDKETRINIAEAFFNRLFAEKGEIEAGVVERIPTNSFSYLWTKQDKKTFPFDVSKPATRRLMAQKAIELNDAGYDVYCAVNLTNTAPTQNARVKTEQVTIQTAVIADIDVQCGAHKSEKTSEFPPDIDTAKSFLPEFDGLPTYSMLVNSGYGLHVYYIYGGSALDLTEKNPGRDNAQKQNKEYIDAIRRRAGKFAKSVDGVHDLPRIMRCPGTYNYRLGRDNAPLCRVIEDTGYYGTFSDLKIILKKIETPAQEAVYNEDVLSFRSIIRGKREGKESEKVKTTAQIKKSGVDSPEYDAFRQEIMLDSINPADLIDTDWLAVISAAKNLGIDYAVVDAWNRRDPNRYNEKENLQRWNSLNDPSYDIETLHGIAKRFGYAEKSARREWYKLHPELSKQEASQAAQIAKNNFDGESFLKGETFDLDNARRLEKFGGDFIRWLKDDEIWLTYDSENIWTRRSEQAHCLYPATTAFSDRMYSFACGLMNTFTKKFGEAFITAYNKAKKGTKYRLTTAQEIVQAVDKCKDAFNVAGIFKTQSRCNAAIGLLKGCSSILITNDNLNRHKNLFCVQNGIVDLQTGKLYPFNPKYLITNQASAIFNPNADTAFVEKFFAEIIPDESTRRAILRYLGYCLTGEKKFHICHFWQGNGANGKSTVLDILIKLLNDYAVKLPPNSMLESTRPLDANSASPALALLDGDIRLAILDEIPRNCRLDAAVLKIVTGDEFVTARFLYQNPRKIELRAKLILNGNHLPNFDVDDGGLQRRITKVTFTETFPADRADPALPAKLATPENRAALLKILVNEAKNFYQEGLLESEKMKQDKAAYFNENDFVADFVDEYCIVGEGHERRSDFERKLCSVYPAETSRLKKKDLLRVICQSLENFGVRYTTDRKDNNIFDGITIIR